MRTKRIVVAIVVAVVGVLAGSSGPPPAGALTEQAATFTGLACASTSSTSSSSWGSATAPADAVAARFTVVGGGGAGGQRDGGDGGPGGAGGVVTGQVAVTPGQVLWGRLGCGGTAAAPAAGWSVGGPAGDARAGGGGGSTGLCLGTAAAACSGGSMIVVAAGGGGGGGGATSGFFCSTNVRGGVGGSAAEGTSRPAHGGTAAGGGRGGRASSGDGPAGHGGGGGGGGGQGPTSQAATVTTADDTGGAPGGDLGGATAGASMPSVPPAQPSSVPSGGRGSPGEGVGGGGGGAGYTGGGGGGGGRDDGVACMYGGASGGGGAGASWVRSAVTQPAFASVGGVTAACSGAVVDPGQLPRGLGGTTGSPGCSGAIAVTWIRNRAPAGAGATHDVPRGAAFAFSLAASDPDGDTPLTCEVVEGPTEGTLTGSGCSRRYTAPPSGPGQDTLTYRVRDARGATSPTYTVTFVAPPVDQAPTSEDGAWTVAPSSSTSITLGGSDPDGGPSWCRVTTPVTGGWLSGGTGCTRTYRAPAEEGTYSFRYVRTDGALDSSPATVTITVADVAPDLAVTSSHAGPFPAGGHGEYTITVTNVGDAPTEAEVAVVDTFPQGMTFADSDDAHLAAFDCWWSVGAPQLRCDRWEPLGPGESTSFTVLVAVGTSTGGTNRVRVTTSGDPTAANDTHEDPTAVNAPPTATPASVATTAGHPVAVRLGGSDPDGGVLTYQLGPVVGGTVSGSAPALTFTPAPGRIDDVRFTYTVIDAHGSVSPPATVVIDIARPGIRGVVTSAATGAPLAGVRVRLYRIGVGFTDDPAFTDAAGRYVIGTGASFGHYEIRFSDPTDGHLGGTYRDPATGSSLVILVNGREAVVDHALPAGAEYEVAITNPGVFTVALYDTEGPGTTPTRTAVGVTGRVTFRGLPAGIYRAVATDPSGALIGVWTGNQVDRSRSRATSLQPGQTARETVTLRAPRSVAGTVIDSEGPVEGVTVQVYDADTGTFVRSTKTDAEGEYLIRPLAVGRYKVVFRDTTGAHPVTWWGTHPDVVIGMGGIVVVTAGSAPTVDQELPRSATLTGTVTGGWGGTTPLAGARVTIYRDGAALGSATTGPDGSYTAPNLPAGEYVLLFTAGGHRTEYQGDAYRRVDATVEVVEPGSVHAIDATLSPS
jgi:uncharacterized repeat protein (TIGR01451 family)